MPNMHNLIYTEHHIIHSLILKCPQKTHLSQTSHKYLFSNEIHDHTSDIGVKRGHSVDAVQLSFKKKTLNYVIDRLILKQSASFLKNVNLKSLYYLSHG